MTLYKASILINKVLWLLTVLQAPTGMVHSLNTTATIHKSKFPPSWPNMPTHLDQACLLQTNAQKSLHHSFQPQHIQNISQTSFSKNLFTKYSLPLTGKHPEVEKPSYLPLLQQILKKKKINFLDTYGYLHNNTHSSDTALHKGKWSIQSYVEFMVLAMQVASRKHNIKHYLLKFLPALNGYNNTQLHEDDSLQNEDFNHQLFTAHCKTVSLPLSTCMPSHQDKKVFLFSSQSVLEALRSLITLPEDVSLL